MGSAGRERDTTLGVQLYGGEEFTWQFYLIREDLLCNEIDNR